MKVIDYNMIPSWAADTKTMKLVGSLLGDKPEKLSTVVTLRPDLTISMITDGLKNVYMAGNSTDKFRPINAMSFTWKIQTHMIPKIRIVEDNSETGEGRAVFALILEKKYYDKGDTFRLENDQLLFVRAQPERLSADRWKYLVTLVGDDSSRKVNVAKTKKGNWTQYNSNYFPELSERGYSKFMFNVEEHRGYISRHRVSDSWSSDYAVLEDVYMQHGKEYFKMDSFDKRLLDLFLWTRENNLLFGESNHDILGKCLDQDEMGRDIPMSDGVITQFQRYCSQQRYSTLATTILDDAIDDVVSKSGKSIGNSITVVCNRRMYKQLGQVLKNDLRFVANANGAFYHTKNGDKIKVGAHFNAYHVQGNDIIFTVDEALTLRYPDQGYGLFMDTTVRDGQPNISLMTLAGRKLISGTIAGMGGLDGKTSGEIVTSVDGSEKHLIGYSGAMVANPYAGHIIKENIVG